MKTAAQIVAQMEDEMPHFLSLKVKPYVIEVMEIYAAQREQHTSIEFGRWLYKNATPRFPNANEWYLRDDEGKDITFVKTTEQLYEIFKQSKQQSNG